MRLRLAIAAAGILTGLALRFIFAGGIFGEGEVDPKKDRGGPPSASDAADPAGDSAASMPANEESLGGLVPPIAIGGVSGSSDLQQPRVTARLMASLGDEFAHDPDAHFHPHGHEICASGCATSNHPTKTLTESEFHRLMEEFAAEPLTANGDDCPAFEALLYYGRQAREMIEREGTGPLDRTHAIMLESELAKTHAIIEMRVVDEHGKVRSWIEPTHVPLDRRHVFDMKVNRVQPLVTSGTVKRTGLDHLWTRL